MASIVNVIEVVGGPICVSAEDGQKVFDRIFPLLQERQEVVLSFEDVQMMISAFLNVAIGQLYGKQTELTEADLKKYLSYDKLEDDDLELLEHVIDNAKRYFSNREAYDQAWKETVEHAE